MLRSGCSERGYQDPRSHTLCSPSQAGRPWEPCTPNRCYGQNSLGMEEAGQGRLTGWRKCSQKERPQLWQEDLASSTKVSVRHGIPWNKVLSQKETNRSQVWTGSQIRTDKGPAATLAICKNVREGCWSQKGCVHAVIQVSKRAWGLRKGDTAAAGGSPVWASSETAED